MRPENRTGKPSEKANPDRKTKPDRGARTDRAAGIRRAARSRRGANQGRRGGSGRDDRPVGPPAGLILRRLLAFSVDGFAVQIPAAVLGAVLLALFTRFGPELAWGPLSGGFDRLTIWAVGAFVVCSTIIESLALVVWGATPGRHLFGLTVTNADTTARPSPTGALTYCLLRLAPVMVVGTVLPAALAVLVAAQLAAWWRSGLSLQELIGRVRVRDRSRPSG